MAGGELWKEMVRLIGLREHSACHEARCFVLQRNWKMHFYLSRTRIYSYSILEPYVQHNNCCMLYKASSFCDTHDMGAKLRYGQLIQEMNLKELADMVQKA